MKSAIHSIFKAFLLSVLMIAQVHFAFAQTASILPPAKTTFVDQNGKPITSGTVDFYIPSTTTRKTTWQDAAETIPNTNPVVLDSAGRALILGSGSYRQVVKDRNGNLQWDQVTSSTGSGSSGPTATGDGDLVGTIKSWAGLTAPNQYLFTYGQEISRTTYSVLFTAITSTQAVFCTSGSPILTGLSDTTNVWIGEAVEISCVVSGASTIISKTSNSITLAANSNTTTNTNVVMFPWGNGNASTTFNLPDLRGFVIAGNNNMGGVASSNLTTTYFGSTNPNSIGAAGGSQSTSITLALANLPTGITSTGSVVVQSTANPGQKYPTTNGVASSVPTVSSGSVIAPSTGAASWTYDTSMTGTTTLTSNNTSGTAYVTSIVQPTKTTNYIIKVTPDANSASASGVTDLGGMTGSIACGSGLLCTGNIISNTANTLPTPYTVGDLLYASSTTVLSKLSDVAVGQPLISKGVGVAPSYSGTWLNLDPTNKLIIINKNTVGWTPANVHTLLNLIGPDSGLETSTECDAFNTDCVFAGGRANGTAAAPTALANNDQISTFVALGNDGTGATPQQGGVLQHVSCGIWSNTSHCSDIRFFTIKASSTTLVETSRMLGGGGAWYNADTASLATTPPAALPAGSVWQYQALRAANGFISLDVYGTSVSPFMAFRDARGVPGIFTATQNADALGTIAFLGATAANTFQSPIIGSTGGAFIAAQAAETFSGTNMGSRFQFYTTPLASVTPALAMQVNASGCISIGVNNDCGIGSITLIGNIQARGTVPVGTTGSCVASSFVGGATAGKFNAAVCTAGTIILSSLPTAPNGYTCDAQDQTTPADTLKQTANTVTSVTFTATTVAADVIAFKCLAW